MNCLRKVLSIISPYDGSAIGIGFQEWKREIIPKYLDKELIYVGRIMAWLLIFVPWSRKREIYCWGYAEPFLYKYINLNVNRVEDGFIRSVGLGCERVLPSSLVVDRSGYLYFDSRGESELEKLIKEKSTLNEREADQSSRLKELIVKNSITKYNLKVGQEGVRIASKKRIALVVGQCEDDKSILFGSGGVRIWTVRDLLLKCRVNEPGAHIVYRQHPDVTAGKRKQITSQKDIEKLSDSVDLDSGITDLIDAADVVYVITSLAGFEALLRGKSVVVLGQPFYGGWGLTKDLTPFPSGRRGEERGLLTVLYCAYIQYPEYFSLKNSRKTEVFDVLQEFKRR